MVDLKKLAMGRKAFTRMEKGSPETQEEKPDKRLEESCRDEIGEVESAFRDRLEKEDKRRRLATDSEFWFAVHFQSREEKERFIRKYGLDRIGDKYLDGRMVDRVLDRRPAVRDGHYRERR